MADFATQRTNMVESQVRPSDITDRRIIRAMLAVPREAFCPPAFKSTAYRDDTLQMNDAKGPRARLACAPRTLAKMIQALDLGEKDSVMEIGAGSGYAAAILAAIAAKVIAVEADPALAAAARTNLAALGVGNVTVIEGDNIAAHAAGAPYDAILVNGAVEQVPRPVLDQLKDGGRLVAVVATSTFGKLTIWRRIGGTFDSRVVADAGAPRLSGFEKPREFVF